MFVLTKSLDRGEQGTNVEINLLYRITGVDGLGVKAMTALAKATKLNQDLVYSDSQSARGAIAEVAYSLIGELLLGATQLSTIDIHVAAAGMSEVELSEFIEQEKQPAE